VGLSQVERKWVEKYWRATNYIAAAAVYLKDNALLEHELESQDIKDALLGHWGTCPGINFVYTHLNLLISKTDANVLLLTGPGHGFAAVLANEFMEGSLAEWYPEYSHGKEGLS
jgi:xylulose-5-phosphate/fructose-6-phosphate phosphoketolase